MGTKYTANNRNISLKELELPLEFNVHYKGGM